MKQNIPTPIAVIVILIALTIALIVGWVLINPPDPQPAPRPEGLMRPATPGQQPQQQAPTQPGQPTPGASMSEPM